MYGKEYGRALNTETFKHGLWNLFRNSAGRYTHPDIIRDLVVQLKALRKCVETMSVRCYGSSLLIVYDGEYAFETDVEDLDESINQMEECTDEGEIMGGVARVTVKWIDFAHSHFEESDSGPDVGVLFGLDNLISMLDELLLIVKRC
jgi:hypothetical protein